MAGWMIMYPIYRILGKATIFLYYENYNYIRVNK